MAFSLNFMCFVGIMVILQVLWSDKLYVNGCYTSIISFGDSLDDTGNLKQLASISGKVFPYFSPPYGENFFHKPTGRCSNGRLIIDFLAEILGLPFIPPFFQDEGSDSLGQGVNYAVAGATALDSSFLKEKGVVTSMEDVSLEFQMTWFKQSLSSVCRNASDCRSFIGRSLILMGEIGGNDYNYQLLVGKPIDEIQPFVPLVIDNIISAVNELIEMGAQTLVVPGNFPIGCSSAYLTILGSDKEEYDPTTGCLIRLNHFAEYHNALLQTKLHQIRERNPNISIIYADYYNAAMQIFRSPNKFGFTNGVLKACCGGGGPFNYNVSAKCQNGHATVCAQPDTYANWDGLHLTEAAYKLISTSLFQGSFTTPRFHSICPTSASQFGVGLASCM